MPVSKMNLHSGIGNLSGVGKSGVQKFLNLGIKIIDDILWHFPYQYEDKTRVIPIDDVTADSEVLIEGKLVASRFTGSSRKVFICDIQDVTGTMQLRFFNASPAHCRYLSSLKFIRCFGKVHKSLYGYEMIHPECFTTNTSLDKHLTPIYSSVAGLSQKLIRKVVVQALEIAAVNITEDLSSYSDDKLEILPSRLKNTTLLEALQQIHFPDGDKGVNCVLQHDYLPRQRIAFEELLANRLYFLKIKLEQQANLGIPLPKTDIVHKVISTLPFSLTASQAKVVQEISADLTVATPMMRLLQGDVGSGKTLVALLSILQAVSNGYQGVLMVPTDILSQQHFVYAQKLLADTDIKVIRLSGKMDATDKLIAHHQITHANADIIIGTQALIQEKVNFANVALVIVDEQHKFGVGQRDLLLQKASARDMPHLLVMSATPIPRTLAMNLYADLDISSIDELPAGRKPITTSAVSNSKRNQLINKLNAYCQDAGGQVYWVCNLIEHSDKLKAQAAESVYADLLIGLPHLKIGLVHGRLSVLEKQQVMDEFKQGKIDILVATTVIEVGVDVANAGLMVIDNAERLSLTQLHQLRGRVGRGSRTSYCILLYHPPISEVAYKRLEVIRNNRCGFKIAQKDLEMRGCGELLGMRQSGLVQFKVADIVKDKVLLPCVQQSSVSMLSRCINSNNLIDRLILRWCSKFSTTNVNFTSC